MPVLSLGSQHAARFSEEFDKQFEADTEGTSEEKLQAHLTRLQNGAIDLNITISMLENVAHNIDMSRAEKMITLAQYNDALINTVAELSGETLKCRTAIDGMERDAGSDRPVLEEQPPTNKILVSDEMDSSDEDRAEEDASATESSILTFHFWGPIVQSALGVLLALIIIGTLVMHFRMEWPWEYSLYWTVVTAFTVGYGDSPSYKFKCLDELVNYTNETEGYIYDADNLTYTIEVCETSHRSIADRPFDMFFVMVFACATVACATTLLTEFLEGLAYRERQRMALAKKVLLEAYINGRSEELTDEEIHEKIKKEENKQRRSSSIEHGALRKATSIGHEEEEDEDEEEDDSKLMIFVKFIVNRPKLRWSLQLLLVMLIGIFYYIYAKEKGSFMEALYWVVISGLAVGYGDLSPSDAPGQLFCFFYIFILVPHVYAVISVMVRTEAPVQSVLGRSLSLELMNVLDRDHDGMVTKEEYLGAVLVMLEKTDFDTVDLILEHFNVLDQDGNGVLDRQDILMLSKKNYRPSTVFRTPASPGSIGRTSDLYHVASV